MRLLYTRTTKKTDYIQDFSHKLVLILIASLVASLLTYCPSVKMANISDVSSLPFGAGEDTFELHALQSELEAVEKQIHDLLVRQAELRDRRLALETSRADAHKSVINVTNPLTPTSSTPCVYQHWFRAPRSRSAMVSFTPAPTRHHEP